MGEPSEERKNNIEHEKKIKTSRKRKQKRRKKT